MMDDQVKDTIQRAAAFKALGDPTRLRILQFLRGCCTEVSIEDDGSVRCVDGPTVGEVCCQITGGEKITSTISFHLKELRNAGLITMTKRGKQIVCSVNEASVSSLCEFL